MEVAVVADEVLGTDGGICIHGVRFEVLDCKGHVRTVRIDYSAAESAARVLLVVHSETVPARSDGPGLVDLGPTTARALSALRDLVGASQTAQPYGFYMAARP